MTVYEQQSVLPATTIRYERGCGCSHCSEGVRKAGVLLMLRYEHLL